MPDDSPRHQPPDRPPDGVTARQQAAWSTGDFHRIGVSQVIVGELLVRDLRVHAGERVLDVAAGSGNTALAAARRWADVTCTDYVPALLDRARDRAAAEGLPMRFEVADAQQLPYADDAFDVVTSTFGAMFAPDQERTAAELLRVLRPGGRLGLASWTPASWVSAQFALQARYRPPPPGLSPPSRWGTAPGLAELFGAGLAEEQLTTETFEFVHPDTRAVFELFRDWFGPVAGVLAAVDRQRAAEFEQEWLRLSEQHNVAADGSCVIPSPYLQLVAVKRPQ
jgi:SAM-dependent methyltransferase